MNTKKNITYILFVIYILLLTWMIVLKFQTSFTALQGARIVNLIPLKGTTHLYEIVMNIAAFVPFGIFMGMLKDSRNFFVQIIPIFMTSLAYELIQYVFAIGRTDITDLISNTLGGMIGIFIFILAKMLFKNNTIKVLNITMIVLTLIEIALIILVLSGKFLRFNP